MKKLHRLPLYICLLMFFCFCACSKDPDAPKTIMSLIEKEPTININDDKVSVFFSGNIVHKGVIKSITLKLGVKSNLSDATSYIAQMDGTSFSVLVQNIDPGAEYYYCYSIDYGLSADYVVETKKIMTPSLLLPTVVTEEITSLGVRGNVTSDGGSHVTERGICWGKNLSPDILSNHIASGEGTGAFMVALSGLEPGVYYVRAYATNNVGTAYGRSLMLVAKGSCQ